MYLKIKLIDNEWVVGLWENDNGFERFYATYIITGNQEDGYEVYNHYNKNLCLYFDNSLEKCLVWILNS